MAEPSGDRHRMRRSSCIRSESMFFAIPHPDEEEKAPEKEQELTKEETSVLELIQNAILIHPSRAVSEVLWFHRNLGLDPFYFRSSSTEQVSEHIMALYAAKILAATSNERLALRLQHETPENALYIVPSLPGVVGSPSEKVEYRIEAEYLREGYTTTLEDERLPFEVAEGGYRLQVYRTSGTISPVSNTRLRMYFLQRPKYVEEAPKDPELRAQWEKVTDLNRIADVDFLANSSESLRSQYTSILEEAVDRLGPVYRIVKSKGDEAHMIIAYRYQTTHSFLSGMTALYHYHGLHSSRKYIERFSNGMCIMSLYLYPSKTLTRYSESVSLEERVRRVGEECSLIYVLPRTSLSTLFRQGTLSAAEVAYSYVVWKFAHQFLNSIGDEEFDKINARLDAPSRGVLSKVRQGLKRDAMTESRVAEVIFNYTDIVQALYADFERVFGLPEESNEQNGHSSASSSVQGRKRSNSIRHEELLSTIRKRATSELDSRILSSFLLFNRQLLKTNFFKKSKVSLSFRLDPSFLSKADYPTTPFAIFFVVGAEFRGFHVRFCDVARGGIRIIRSNNSGSYAINVSTLFEENYNLALTQQRKNKDIPEGGSKGTVLLSVEHQDKPLVAFRKYVDALLDLLLPSEEVRDFYQKPELLFLGPDEGTADYMNWASQHAKHRQYAFWKSFTTGKSRSIGGIPHDFYGMTTRSIHQFVVGILRHLDLDERTIRKFQTGGPDGDLGSNEIKISHDRTVAVVDGSGVLCDPEGINREELLRLATLRLMSRHFDRSKLSPQGFFVDEKDVDVKLPNGRLIEKGLMFRNNFHLEPDYLALVDMFVPCGGRPAAVNISNVHLLYDNENKKPRLKYVVEGANLFFTQEARLQLEEWGVIVFKDASANKGGVTSSSLEVLSALALSDEEFEQHMMVKDDEKVPAFYAEYVQEVQRIIEERAKEEFECLWKEHEQTRVPRSELTDTLSEKINRLNDDIVNSSLWSNAKLRVKVISQAIPRNLVQLLGIDVVMQRVPESYLKAIFGAFLASRFVYTRGLNAGEFGFFEFMNDYLQQD